MRRAFLRALSIAAGVLLAVVALVACAGVAVTTAPGDGSDPGATSAQQDAARAYLAASLTPLPDDWRTDRFDTAPGIVLETGALPARGTRRGTVVFVPGYTAPLEMYADEMVRLADAGWDVAAVSQRGQGRSTRTGPVPDMGHVTDYADLTADLASFVAAQAGPVAIVAVSKGGHVALRTAAERAPDILGLAAIVPMVEIRTDPFPGWIGRTLAETMVRTGLGERYAPGPGSWDRAALFDPDGGSDEPTRCSGTPERAHMRDALFTLDSNLRVDAPSMAWVAATLRSQDRLRALGPAIAVPTLMVTAGRDTIVRSDAAARLCDVARDCRRIHLPDAMHCALEGDRATSARIMDDVVAFLDTLAP
ncbi:alpha/beta fold hydrolase [Jannaschia sp. LMIT008]|uniref:alpha/beta fold hydrolase n=1 Tax=Jannaschia maritima TaxID=3032585 RepID=UPI002811C185|nr:alpha/beta fold hydrolase [Jannaschia sp. LMIT008]